MLQFILIFVNVLILFQISRSHIALMRANSWLAKAGHRESETEEKRRKDSEGKRERGRKRVEKRREMSDKQSKTRGSLGCGSRTQPRRARARGGRGGWLELLTQIFGPAILSRRRLVLGLKGQMSRCSRIRSAVNPKGIPSLFRKGTSNAALKERVIVRPGYSQASRRLRPVILSSRASG